MNSQVYWIWLTNLPNINCEKITFLLEHFNTAKDIYDAKDTEFVGIYGIDNTQINSLSNKNLDTAKNILDRVNLAKARVLTYDDINYPDMLRKIFNPPYVLYIKGEIMDWDRLLCISVIGTRQFTEYGKNVTNHLCTDLAKAGITIVSGMARGIDSLAAIAALKAGNKTIAVLGCGIDVVYPPENEKLMNVITKNGAVITEYPPGTRPLGCHFPERNRIISGLSKGTLVIEAPLKSGTLITANHTVENGKDLFSVPGHIYQKMSQGSNMLIKRGAKLVMCANDILEEYSYEMNLLKISDDKNSVDVEYECKTQETKVKTNQITRVNNVKKISIDDKRYNALKEKEKIIISMLIDDNLHIDDIVRKSEMEIKNLNPMLLLLEMQGFINKLPGNNYKLNI